MLIILWYNRINKGGYYNEYVYSSRTAKNQAFAGNDFEGGKKMNPFIYHELTEIATLLDESLKVMKEILEKLKEVKDDEHRQE